MTDAPRFEVLERGDALWRILDRRYDVVEYVLIYGASFARGFVAVEFEEHQPDAREAMLHRLNRYLGRLDPADPADYVTGRPPPARRPPYPAGRTAEDRAAAAAWNAYLGRDL